MAGHTYKRLLAMLMVASLIAAVFTGCSSTDDTEEIVELRHENPELFLEEALERSGITTRPSPDFSALDLSRFRGSPTEHNLSLVVNEADPYFLPLPGRPQVELTLLADTTAGNFLMDFDITGAGPFSFEGNRIFVSPDMLALSVPELYDRHRYVTVNPNTFADQWNASLFSTALTEIDPNAINAMLSMLESIGETQPFDFSAIAGLFEQLAGVLTATGEFRDGGDAEITVGEATHNAARLGYYIPAREANALVNEAFGALLELAPGNMGGILAMMPTGADMQAVEPLSFDFPAGAYIYHYVDLDTGLVLQSRVPGTAVVVCNGSHTEEMTLEAVTYYHLGEQNIINVTQTIITLAGISGSEIKIDIYQAAGGPYIVHMHMDMGQDGVIIFQVNYSGEGTLGLTANFFDNGPGHVRFNFWGDVANTPEEFTLSNGFLTITTDDITTLDVDFEYSLRSARAGDIRIDLTQAIDLFDINFLQLAGILSRLAIMGIM